MHRRHLLAIAALALTPPAVVAQGYPNKPIRLVVPFAPGGATDVLARILAGPLSRELGQTVFVENKAGGGGVIGANEVVRAAPDGYTLGTSTISTIAANPAVNPRIPYNPLTDFTPISVIATTPSALAVTPGFPANDWTSFVAELRKPQGTHTYASSGVGGVQHLTMEQLRGLTGTTITHVPYRGGGPALTDTMAGQVSMVFDQMPSILPYMKDGRLKPIVVAAPKRLDALPGVPTFEEVGLPEMNRMAFVGLVGPKGLPKDIVVRLNRALHAVMRDPAMVARIAETGSFVGANQPEEFTQMIARELEVFRQVVTRQNITLD